MTHTFRNGFYAGVLAAVVIGIYLFRLWQPERQVRLHSEHLLSAINDKDWAAVAQFFADDYHDEWNEDRSLALEHLREVVGAFRSLQFASEESGTSISGADGTWRARITAHGGGEFATSVVERLNAVQEPFDLRWRRGSSRPWDWKLVSATNPALELPEL